MAGEPLDLWLWHQLMAAAWCGTHYTFGGGGAHIPASEAEATAGSMMLSNVERLSLRRTVLLIIAVAGSQLGHAVAYFLKYGLGAASTETTGVHTYFPALSATLGALVGGALMATFILLAAVRLVDGVPLGCRRQRTARAFDILPTLFVAQLAIFVGQEMIETLVAGGPIPSVIELLFWGAIGQLPAALLSAFVLSWLSARIEAAWTCLVAAAARIIPGPALPAREPTQGPEPVLSLALAATFPPAFLKRGPPLRVPLALS